MQVTTGRPSRKTRTNLGEVITLRRQEQKMTQQDVATRAGLTREVYQRIECAPEKTSVATLRRIAAALGTPTHDLLYWAHKHEEKRKVEVGTASDGV